MMRGTLSGIIVGRAPALGQRLFRLYFYGQICSVLGTFIQAVALSWLVYRLTGSPALLGAVAFLSQAPQLVVGPLAGVMIDRFDRRRILIVLQSLFALQAVVLTVLVAFDWIAVWHILTLALVLGILSSFDLPSRQSLLLYLVDDKLTLANAVALNSAVVHTGRLVGPPIAGLLLAFVPESVCFLINALSYLGPIYAVMLIRADMPTPKPMKTGSALAEVARFIRKTGEAKLSLGSVAMVNATASTYIVLMPVFAKDVFGGAAQSLGILLGMGGAGALVAAVYMSTRARSGVSIRFALTGCLLGAAGLLGFAIAGYLANFWLALPMVALMGAGIGLTNIAGNTRLQYLAPDSLRGRVISIFGSVRFGFDALGGLIAGTIAAYIGVLPVVLLLVLLLCCGCWGLSRRMRVTGEAH